MPTWNEFIEFAYGHPFVALGLTGAFVALGLTGAAVCWAIIRRAKSVKVRTQSVEFHIEFNDRLH
jgi:hypothetical protein